MPDKLNGLGRLIDKSEGCLSADPSAKRLFQTNRCWDVSPRRASLNIMTSRWKQSSENVLTTIFPFKDERLHSFHGVCQKHWN